MRRLCVSGNISLKPIKIYCWYFASSTFQSKCLLSGTFLWPKSVCVCMWMCECIFSVSSSVRRCIAMPLQWSGTVFFLFCKCYHITFKFDLKWHHLSSVPIQYGNTWNSEKKTHSYQATLLRTEKLSRIKNTTICCPKFIQGSDLGSVRSPVSGLAFSTSLLSVYLCECFCSVDGAFFLVFVSLARSELHSVRRSRGPFTYVYICMYIFLYR